MFDASKYDTDLHCVFDVYDIHGKILGTICSLGTERALAYAKTLFGDRVFAVVKSFKEITC
jgi:hypothetical protein